MSNKQGKRLNPFQHILHRPDMYIGSTKSITKEMWVYEEKEKNETEENEDEQDEKEDVSASSQGSFVLRPITYNQGLSRIFIEASSNAIDNVWRSQQHNIVMKKIEYVFDNDPESEMYGWITVLNDGYAIPVEKAEYEYEDYRSGKSTTELLYPAEVFFGEMLAGTNFEEDETRKTSGTNGSGSKCLIVFSKKAIIDHTDSDKKKRFVQIYEDNGTKRTAPKITAYSGKSYTKISFLPDYERFEYDGMDHDLFSYFKRFVYEAAMITGLPVTLNGEKIVVKDLNKFARLFYPNVKENHMVAFKAPNGDECVVMERGIPESNELEEVPHLSWINGINTRDGGVHVDVWQNTIFPLLVRIFNARKPKKGEKTALKASAKQLYPYFVIFVRAEAPGPRFNGQTKDKMVSPEIELVDENDKKQKKEFAAYLTTTVTKMLKWNFTSLLEERLAMNAELSQNRKDGTKKRVTDNKNCQNANLAGTKDSWKCTLFITEGLSAKAFADRLVSSIENGTDYYGSFAIRGKFINAQKFPLSVINKNEEVIQLKKVLGLVPGEKYDSIEKLRYGKVCFMTDQDDDGLHIRGLLLNFFWYLWPSLFDLVCEDGSPYLMFESFTTMVTMARWGTGKNAQMRMFYSNPDFHDWVEREGQYIRGLKVKYYKGLGTHVPGDELLYLNDQKMLKYTLDGNEPEYMSLGFGGGEGRSDSRKLWITKDMKKPGEICLNEDEKLLESMIVDGEISLSTFVDKQLIIYHRMALRRALPSLYDGFKEAQRKIFYGVMQDPDAKKAPVVVETLAGTVKRTTGYHHGGSSLEDTMIGMAQGFVGSNNIPLLVNAGEMGTRLALGDDAAAPRYPETQLEDISYTIFSNLDQPILELMEENGKPMEPKVMMPVIPMVLVNGPKGVASGFSENIANYNPYDLVERIEAWLEDEDSVSEFPALVPYYRGFTGSIELLTRSGKSGSYELWDPKTSEGKPKAWRSKGILRQGTKGWYHIDDIPIGVRTNKVKEHLAYLETGTLPEGAKKKKKQEEKRSYLLDVRWKGTTNTAKWDIKPAKDFIPDMDVAGNLKILQAVESLTNIYVIDENDYPIKYDSPESLLLDFCPRRLEYYDKRRDYWLEEFAKQHAKESDRYKFVKAVVDKKLNMYQDDDKLEAAMYKLGLRKIQGEKKDAEGNGIESFEYLLSMQMRSMTVKRLEDIKNEVDKIQAKIDDLEAKSAKDLWREDLSKFKVAYAKFLKTRIEESDSTKKIKMR